MTTMEMWQMVLVGFLAICGGFHTIYLAGEHLAEIIKKFRKPSDDVKARLEAQDKQLNSNDERLKKLEKAIDELLKIQPMILRSEYVILQHMRTNNSTGEIAKQEEAINNYLFNR